MDQKKLRILCLHGYRQCDQSFRQKTGSTRKLVKSLADFEFANAPLGVMTDPNVETSRAWWFSNSAQMSFSSREPTEIAVGFEESVENILDFMEKNGPFDGLLGFSQGASMVHLLLAKAELGQIALPGIRFAMFFSGFLSLSEKHRDLTEAVIKNIPSLHVSGTADEIVAKEKSDLLSERFSIPPVRINHDGGHLVPAMSKWKAELSDFLKQQIL